MEKDTLKIHAVGWLNQGLVIVETKDKKLYLVGIKKLIRNRIKKNPYDYIIDEINDSNNPWQIKWSILSDLPKEIIIINGGIIVKKGENDRSFIDLIKGEFEDPCEDIISTFMKKAWKHTEHSCICKAIDMNKETLSTCMDYMDEERLKFSWGYINDMLVVKDKNICERAELLLRLIEEKLKNC